MSRTGLGLLVLAAAALGQWGRDINPGMGPQLVELASRRLKEVLDAPDRAAAIRAFVAEQGAPLIEATKRFRDPALEPLFLALLDHEDWHVRHRALLALEYYGGSAVVDRAWPLLRHPHRRLREKAAITCLKLWDGRAAPELDELVRNERDFHVRKCLEALQRRVAGKLKPERVVAKEHRVRDERGLTLTPFVSGMDVKLTPVARTGKGSAGRLPPAERWVAPLLGQGEEEVQGVSLQPFANPRAGGRVHTGLDVGACLDGAGFYAPAAGVVKLIHTGSDMGTLLVIEHHLAPKSFVTSVFMHGGDTVFVEAGEVVEAGQLIGTMGLGFSAENGGHFAHLHLGLYPGPFAMNHNYGYKLATQGLDDWFDPATVLPRWIERTAPLLADLRPLDKALAPVERAAAKGEYGKAYAAAWKAREAAEPGGDLHVDATYLVDELAKVPAAAVARATTWRDAGHPGEAVDRLRELAPRCRGVPGAEAIDETLDAWLRDPAFGRALKGEKRLATTEARAARLDDPAKVRALWQKLLDEYGDTCLAPRIREHLR